MKIRKLISAISIAVLIIGILPMPVEAVGSATGSCVEIDACFYSEITSSDTICDPTLGGAAGSGPMYGPLFPKVSDTQKLADSILQYMKNTRPDSPLATQEYANKFVALGMKYDVNPAMGVAQLLIETSLGTTGHARPPKYNPFNVRNGPGSSFGNYPGYSEAIEAYFSLIKRVYTGPPSNLTTVEAVINKYAPPSDGNNVSQYLKITLEVMQKILGNLGGTEATAETTAPADPANPPATTPASTTATSSCAPGADGSIGWQLTGSPTLVNYDQTDPKYSSHPYGANKSAIGESGCGPTSVAMVVASLTGNKSINPITIADKYGDRFHVSSGSDHGLFPAAANDYNLNIQTLGTDLTKVPEIIKAGGLVIISVSKGHFTNGGHIMVIRAVTNDGTGFFIADPNGDGLKNDSEKRSFDAAFLSGQGGLKAIWGYTKK